ncbi:MAG: hypothetical protein ACK5LP_02420 [Campylobacteraceae bacterium]
MKTKGLAFIGSLTLFLLMGANAQTSASGGVFMSGYMANSKKSVDINETEVIYVQPEVEYINVGSEPVVRYVVVPQTVYTEPVTTIKYIETTNERYYKKEPRVTFGFSYGFGRGNGWYSPYHYSNRWDRPFGTFGPRDNFYHRRHSLFYDW